MLLIDNVILVLLSLLTAIFSLLMIIFPFEQVGPITSELLVNFIKGIKENYIYVAIGLALLLLSIRMLLIGLKIKGRKDNTTYLIQQTDCGEILISSETVKGLVESVFNKFTGIKNITTKVRILDGQIFINLKGEVYPEINIPETTKQLQNKVKEHVENSTGVKVSEIKVIISNVALSIRSVK
ncbi:alkaline shock response membrane anchor protein AmaP [Tepidimicrobium xylanilyticum]|uniref:Uncharacterized conserved protein YloU, alkaline shock protein (Asp23) family n=1 Tax=Tepidimicrobium xylanilyticum TaxID=1123352 RepID=A0A1H3CRC2_9FIRM|nr:alkaline shock response membrane anchor protein AmaP [Tepidimicrobium xylanilyticum]SDX56711.1 Uncharacterized conserved protein YloU, alkaline shock protein (Asp23) family [Tepidimicrobium xylanilyticum]